MLNVMDILQYVIDCLEDYNEDNPTLEGGIEAFLTDYKNAIHNPTEINFDGFVQWQRSCLCFDYEYNSQKKKLTDWGKSEDSINNTEMDFYTAIWPYMKVVLEDYKNNNVHIYTSYASRDDITFIMQEKAIYGGKDIKLECIGFYFGEPEEAITKRYAQRGSKESLLWDVKN